MGYVKLPDILQKIIEVRRFIVIVKLLSLSQNLSSGEFKDIKPILMRMLETYNYEEVSMTYWYCFQMYKLTDPFGNDKPPFDT